ncbi:MAG: arsinothricin resistance N-acetyltransferase ArsN1 family B [Rhodospirillaceae bacterium]
MARMEVREATPADAEAICGIYNPYVANTVITFERDAVTVDDMAARINNVRAAYPWLLSVADGEILGYAYATRWRTRAAYDFTAETTIYLAPSACRRGIGYELYRALLDTLGSSGVHAALGCIALPNEGSVALHEKCGFRKAGHFPEAGRKFDRWVDVGFWQILL